LQVSLSACEHTTQQVFAEIAAPAGPDAQSPSGV
jgi:hypothetical protein